jgi:hypothetical protein
LIDVTELRAHKGFEWMVGKQNKNFFHTLMNVSSIISGYFVPSYRADRNGFLQKAAHLIRRLRLRPVTPLYMDALNVHVFVCRTPIPGR